MSKNYILEDGLIAKFNLKEFRTMVSRKICSNRKNGLKATREEIFFDIAEKYNLSADSVKRWFKGNGSPQDIEKVKNLAEYFEISINDLLIFDDSDITTISESKKEQTKMDIDNNTYETDLWRHLCCVGLYRRRHPQESQQEGSLPDPQRRSCQRCGGVYHQSGEGRAPDRYQKASAKRRGPGHRLQQR